MRRSSPTSVRSIASSKSPDALGHTHRLSVGLAARRNSCLSLLAKDGPRPALEGRNGVGVPGPRVRESDSRIARLPQDDACASTRARRSCQPWKWRRPTRSRATIPVRSEFPSADEGPRGVDSGRSSGATPPNPHAARPGGGDRGPRQSRRHVRAAALRSGRWCAGRRARAGRRPRGRGHRPRAGAWPSRP